MRPKTIPRISLPLAGLLASLLLGGCAGHHMLTSDPPVATATAGDEPNHMILSEYVYRFSPDGSLKVRTHTVVRIGSHGTQEYLGVVDQSTMRLTAFEARVVHAGGSIDWFGLGDLENYSLSGARMIADESLKFVFLNKIPLPGDIVEMAYEHDDAFPQFGMLFRLGRQDDPPGSVRCTIEVPWTDTLLYRVLNDSLSPRLSRNGDFTAYTFSWTSPVTSGKRSLFAKSNYTPGVMAIDPARGPSTWKGVGEWYLGLIAEKFRPDDAITALAKRVTQSAAGDVDKMNAIAVYCQSALRYEQVYLPRGEFIPNSAPAILAKKFGDCKDYACLMVSMARAVGVVAHPALCYRGRGYQVDESLPVDQFNHMIAHLRSGGKDYWYDGTNKSGIAAVTADDLVNVRALILEKGNSRMATIPESEENNFSVRGVFHPRGSSLAGTMHLRLAGQYAILFQFLAQWYNETAMESALSRWAKEVLADRLTAGNLRWASSEGGFDVDISCVIPDALDQIEGTTYLQFDRIFDTLLPSEEPGRFRGEPYYLPGYARGTVTVDLPEFTVQGAHVPFHWEFRFALPPGPYARGSGGNLADTLAQAKSRLGEMFKLSTKE